jgi:hypothetical protein
VNIGKKDEAKDVRKRRDKGGHQRRRNGTEESSKFMVPSLRSKERERDRQQGEKGRRARKTVSSLGLTESERAAGEAKGIDPMDGPVPHLFDCVVGRA